MFDISLGLAIKGLLVAGALLVGSAATYYFKLKPDNAVEELAEEVIKQQTGLDIDLSPGTPESVEAKKKLI